MSIPFHMYINASPILLLSIASMITVLFPSFGGKQKYPLYFFSLIAVGATLLALAFFPQTESYWKGAFISDNLAWLGHSLVLLTGFSLLILFKNSCLSDRFYTPESVSLFLLTLLGMMIMLASSNLVTLFVGLELSSIGIYILVGYVFPTRPSLEGAIKYLVLGSFASAFLLFGFALLYLASGTMDLLELAQQSHLIGHLWVKMGILFTLVGLFFKLGLIPFHMWVPDAYESAPTGITALMATSVKITVLVLAMRMSPSIPLYESSWSTLITILAVLSMIGGNFLALVQTSLKRMLAYSSIAHSGYMAIVLCAMNNTNILSYQSLMFYLVGYTLSSLLAFGVLMWLEDQTRQNLQLEDLQGLAKTHPWAALSLSLAMFSFAGMPPTVGFLGKFFIFNAALKENLYVLVFSGVAGSCIALFYYLRVLVTMYMRKPESSFHPLVPQQSWILTVVIATLCFAVLGLGTFMPEDLMSVLKPISSNFTLHP